MKHYTGLILRQLTGHARRSSLTIISILLAVALVASVSVIAASIQQTQVNQVLALTGNFHGTFRNLQTDQLALLRETPGTEAVGFAGPIGTVLMDNLTITLEAFDPIGREMLQIYLAGGRFPAAAGEIALEGWLLDQMDPRPALGESFSIDLFVSYSADQASDLPQKIQAEFILVGILEDIPAAKINKVSLGLLSPESLAAFLPAEQIRYNAFVCMNDNGGQARAGLEQLGHSLGFSKDVLMPNDMLLNAQEGGQDAQAPILLLSMLVLAAATATIYNIFQISVVERVRLFGTLRTLGATPGQIRVLVFGEAMILCIVAIPLGLAAGIGTASILSRTLVLLKSMVGVVTVPVEALFAAVAVGLLATLLSALAPACYASRVPPVAAIRGGGHVLGSRSAPGSHSKANFWRKLVGFSGWLAYQNMWRSTGRTVVTLFSFSLGLAMFVAFNSYAGSMNAANVASHFIRSDYALLSNEMSPLEGYPEQVKQILLEQPGIDQVIATHVSNMVYSLHPASSMAEETRARIESMMSYEDIFSYFGEPGYVVASSQLFGFGGNELNLMKDFLLEGSLDAQEMKNQKTILVVDPDGSTGLKVGDTLRLKMGKRKNDELLMEEESFIVAGILSDIPITMGYGTVGPRLVVHEEIFTEFTGMSLYQRFDLTVNDNIDQEILEAQLETLAGQSSSGRVLSYREVLASFEKEKRDILLMAYGVVAVIAIIGLVNITNTLITHLLLRTREYGMLRAVGMTGEQLLSMTRLEALFYGIFGSTFGLLIGSGLAIVLGNLMKAQDPSIHPSVPIGPALIAVAVSIGLSIVATIQPTKYMIRLHIVEALRFVE